MYHNIRKKSFHLTLLSNSSLNYYPENKLSRFTVKLPTPIEFDDVESWDVGITNMSFTTLRNQNDTGVRIVFKNRNIINLNHSIIQILQYCRKTFPIVKQKNFFDKYTDKNVKVPVSLIGKRPFIQIRMKNSNVQLLTDVEYTVNKLFDDIFSQVDKTKWFEEVEFLKSEIQNLKIAMDVNENALIRSWVEEKLIVVKNRPNYVCVYTDIIKPRLFSDIDSRALALIPYKLILSNNSSVDINNIQYCPIERSRITDIIISINDETGEQLDFIDDTFCTMVVLHFRKSI